jgi:DNA primase
LIGRTFITDLLDRVKIEEVVSGYVTLKRSGNSMRGLCPFHNESSPSFHVSPAKGFYYCFGCRSGGNAIKFLQEIEGKSFIEVVRELADKEGIPIPDGALDDKFEQREKERFARQRRHLELLKAVTAVYEKHLWKSPAGEKARRYLASRSISEETARKFKLGYAPEGGANVAAMLRSLKVSPQDAVDVGLIRHGRDGGFYELFRSRIVFPIIVPGGNIVGFSARALPGTEEEKIKYINTPDTAYFHKGEILYGLAQALPAVRKSGSIVLVEGNFDLVSMVQGGFENVAAPLGSALTQKHVEAIGRLGASIVLLFDADAGGVRAAARAFEIIIESGIPVRIALLPAGEDPHSLICARGEGAMAAVLAEARDMIGFMIDQKARLAGGGDVEKVKGLRELWSVLRRAPDDLVRGQVLKKLPQAFKMDERDVKDYLGFKESSRSEVRKEADAEGSPWGGEGVRKEYESILGAAADFPAIAAEIFTRSEGIVDDFAVRTLLHAITVVAEAADESGENPDFTAVAQAITDEKMRDWFMRRVVGEDAQFDSADEARQAAFDSLDKLHRRLIEREIRSKSEQARDELSRGDDDAYMRTLAEQQKLRRKAKKIMY